MLLNPSEYTPPPLNLRYLSFASAETTTLADTVTPTLPADVETTTVPITTTGETITAR